AAHGGPEVEARGVVAVDPRRLLREHPLARALHGLLSAVARAPLALGDLGVRAARREEGDLFAEAGPLGLRELDHARAPGSTAGDGRAGWGGRRGGSA